MPKIKIKRGTNLSTSTDKLLSGELAIDTTTKRLYAGDTDSEGGKAIQSCDDVNVKGADNATYATKIGSESSHPQIGSNTKPVYVDSNGTITQFSGSVGYDSEANGLCPVYVYEGEIKRATNTHGEPTTPVYVNQGYITPCDKYAGGTKVTLNGTPCNSGDVSISAPTEAPSYGGVGKRVALCDRPGTPFWSSGAFGTPTEPLYLGDNGILTKASKYAGGTMVTLNGTPHSGEGVSFYAPTAIGTEANVLTTQDNSLKWSDCAFTNAVYSSESGSVWDTTVNDITKGIYAILAYESSLGEYYTFYVIIHNMTVGNKYVSTSYTTQPSSGFTPSCCVVATVSSASSVNFKVTENSGNRDWYFRRIYKVNNIS